MGFAEVEELINDTERGASELAADAAQALHHLDREEAEMYLVELLKERRAMAPFINLANEFFLAVEKGKDHRPACKSFYERLSTSKKKIVEKSAELMEREEYSHVSTLSYSSTVVKALERSEEVTVFESRPKKEGRKTAEQLASETTVNYWIDAGMNKALKEVEAVFVGADSVSAHSFTNKIGTYLLVLSAHRNNIPVHVLADTTKYLPEGFTTAVEELHPSEEVWPHQNENIRVHNDYFEPVPLDAHDGLYFVTERGIFDREGAAEEIEKKKVSNGLKKHHPENGVEG
ncbi:MAG: hypothetical protein ACOCTR_03490 [Candidatus Natronoplasma sp.]